jgi:hypothetical protein
LGQLHEIESQLIELGYRIIAVSPDRPEKIRETLEKKLLNYLLLSDRGMLGAKAFGIAFRLDDGLLEKYKGFGIDLEGASGESHHMPIPAKAGRARRSVPLRAPNRYGLAGIPADTAGAMFFMSAGSPVGWRTTMIVLHLPKGDSDSGDS